MVLLVDGHRVKLDCLTSHPTLVQASQRFLLQLQAGPGAAAALPPGPKLVYALQGEEATVPADEPVVLCSSDATTCLISVVVGAAAAAGGDAAAAAAPPPIARVVHHDETTTTSAAALQQTVAGLAPGGPPARLWLAGAYCDSRGAGAAVARALLRFLDSCEVPLELQLCCIGAHNTAADGSPHATALAVDLRSGAASPLAPAPRQRGPLLPARMAQWAYCLGPQTSDGASPLRSIYSPATRQLRLTLVQGGPAAHCLWHAAALLALPDSELLQRWSTSPAHEPQHFVADVRASFEWLLQQSGPALPMTWTFTWVDGQGWRPAAEAAEAAAAAAAGDVQSRLSLV